MSTYTLTSCLYDSVLTTIFSIVEGECPTSCIKEGEIVHGNFPGEYPGEYDQGVS